MSLGSTHTVTGVPGIFPRGGGEVGGQPYHLHVPMRPCPGIALPVDLHAMSLSSLEFRENRYREGHNLFTGINEILPCFLHFCI